MSNEEYTHQSFAAEEPGFPPLAPLKKSDLAVLSEENKNTIQLYEDGHKALQKMYNSIPNQILDPKPKVNLPSDIHKKMENNIQKEENKPHAIGIVCDNFKLERFKKELAKNNFDNLEISPLTKDTTVIKVVTPASSQPKIHAICVKVENHFKR